MAPKPFSSKTTLSLLAGMGATLLLFSSCTQAPVPVELGAIYSDHMVLQRERPVPVRGKTEPGAKVKASFRGKTYKATADSAGKFTITLSPSPAGGPFTLKVGDKVLEDILVGDVFFCSGQSNMELPVRRCLDATGQFVKGYSNPSIRYIKVPMSYNFDGPLDDIRPRDWEVLDSDSTAMGWGAVCYFTARELSGKTGVPIGMVNSSVGGSPIEAWMEESTLPDYALSELRRYQDKDYLDKVRYKNAHLYSDWQNAHNALPAPRGPWKNVQDIFSSSWAKDPQGQNIYGSHLLRREFTLTADQASKSGAVLHLGALIDADSTFINGKYVGNTTYMYPPRNYSVPEGVLKEGKNVVEIHLYACGGNPASFVKDKRYSLEFPDGKEVSLLDKWQHKDGRRMPPRDSEVFLQYISAGLYNGMVAPLVDLPYCGVLWYQGESNTGRAATYGELLETMITHWREVMKDEDLPFYIIELAAFEHSELTDNDFGWNRVQKEQRRTAERMDGVYLVPNADLGEWNDIHPQDKKTVGERVCSAVLESRK